MITKPVVLFCWYFSPLITEIANVIFYSLWRHTLWSNVIDVFTNLKKSSIRSTKCDSFFFFFFPKLSLHVKTPSQRICQVRWAMHQSQALHPHSITYREDVSSCVALLLKVMKTIFLCEEWSSNLMMWGYFAAGEAGVLYKDGITKEELCVGILNQHLMTSATEWLFHLNNDPKAFPN